MHFRSKAAAATMSLHTWTISLREARPSNACWEPQVPQGSLLGDRWIVS